MEATINEVFTNDFILNNTDNDGEELIQSTVNSKPIISMEQCFEQIKYFYATHQQYCKVYSYSNISALLDVSLANSKIKELFSLLIDFDYFTKLFGYTDYIVDYDPEYLNYIHSFIDITDVMYMHTLVDSNMNMSLEECCKNYNLLCNLFGVLGLTYSDGKYLCSTHLEIITNTIYRLNYILHNTKFILDNINESNYKDCIVSNIGSYFRNQLTKYNIQFDVQ